MRILVTGATGFLGTHLVKQLQEDGHYIWATGRIDRIGQVINEVHAVIHLAAQTEVGRALKNPVHTFEANIEATWKLLDMCANSPCTPRVIIASSDKAYGDGPVPYKEEQEVRAGAPYETSKACADLIAQCYRKTYDMNIAITRCGNLYGPGRLNWTTIIPGTIKSILQGERPQLRSDGTAVRDFLFIEDAVAAYKALLSSPARGAFNFGGFYYNVRTVVDCICEVMGWRGGVEILNTAKQELTEQRLDNTKAWEKLAWRPDYNLYDGLKKTIPWYVEHFQNGVAT